MNTASQVSKVLKLHFDQGYSYGVIGIRLGMTAHRVGGIIRRHRQPEQIAPRKGGKRDWVEHTLYERVDPWARNAQ